MSRPPQPLEPCAARWCWLAWLTGEPQPVFTKQISMPCRMAGKLSVALLGVVAAQAMLTIQQILTVVRILCTQ